MPNEFAPAWAPWRRCWAWRWVRGPLGQPMRVWCGRVKRHRDHHVANAGFGSYAWDDVDTASVR